MSKDSKMEEYEEYHEIHLVTEEFLDQIQDTFAFLKDAKIQVQKTPSLFRYVKDANPLTEPSGGTAGAKKIFLCNSEKESAQRWQPDAKSAHEKKCRFFADLCKPGEYDYILTVEYSIKGMNKVLLYTLWRLIPASTIKEWLVQNAKEKVEGVRKFYNI